MSKPFVNLHTHSHYSILEASMAPKEVLAKAHDLSCPAVALTDKGVGHGLVEFVEMSAKFEGMKPLLGTEIAVSDSSRFERRAGIDGREGHLVLLAQNQTGWENLLRLLSGAALEGLYMQPRVDWELLEKHAEGLIVLTGGLEGLVAKALHEKGSAGAEAVIKKLLRVFQPEQVVLELVARSLKKAVELNEFIAAQHTKRKLKIVATSAARYLNREDLEAAETLYCIGKNVLVNDPNRPKFADSNWFKSWVEIEHDLAYISKDILEVARENTLAIADSIDLKIKFGRDLLPEFEVDADKTVAEQLRYNCETIVPEVYKHELAEDPSYKNVIQERLDYELSIIGKMGFEAYFLIVQDFIAFAKESGIAVGPGRGSAAGSIVSYLLGITSVDPLKYELLFERFLNPERISMPDVDIDFSDERRDEVLQYVIKKYGTEKVSKVCTFGTLSAKAALKDVGRANGIPFGEMNALTKLLPGNPGFKLEEAMNVTDFQVKVDSDDRIKKVYDTALKLEGCVRHVSVHACAVIIGPRDLSQFAPLQWAPGAEEVKITQVPYQQLEHIGLLKMDFLGLRNLSILEKTLAHIKETTGEEILLVDIPMDDTKTFAMMARGETTGVFQFESDGMRRYLRELKPTEFEDLVAMNALYRPGPMEYIPQYITGKHDPTTVKYFHEDLEPLLNKTYGIAIYQEQIMKIAQVFAGFTLGGADILRKAIGKKKMDLLAEQRKKFIEGAVEKGYQEKMAVSLFDDIIVPFAGYGFNRSHAVCYARIAYETAYLRANYPVEFMTAMMTTDRNNTDRIVLEMNECHAMGIEVLPPSVNDSGSFFSIIPNPNAGSETQKNQADIDMSASELSTIRFGLTAIKGLGEETVKIIIDERNAGGKFKDLQDFAQRVPQKVMNKKSLEALAFSGALDAFGDRAAIAASLEDLAHYAKEFQEKAAGGQMGLFGAATTPSVGFKLRTAQATKKEILHWERESLGLFVSDHPLRGMDEYFEKFGTPINQLEPTPKKKTVKVHGIVSSARKIFTKKGQNMAIITIEDTSGKIDAAVFPRAYEKINPECCQIDEFLCLTGRIEERDGKLNMIVESIDRGNLESIQQVHVEGKGWSEIRKKPKAPTKTISTQNKEVKPVAANVYKIVIPTGTSKDKVTKVKTLLKQNKSKGGGLVILAMNGQEVKVPFPVDVSGSLKTDIDTVLGKATLNDGDGDFTF